MPVQCIGNDLRCPVVQVGGQGAGWIAEGYGQQSSVFVVLAEGAAVYAASLHIERLFCFVIGHGLFSFFKALPFSGQRNKNGAPFPDHCGSVSGHRTPDERGFDTGYERAVSGSGRERAEGSVHIRAGLFVGGHVIMMSVYVSCP